MCSRSQTDWFVGNHSSRVNVHLIRRHSLSNPTTAKEEQRRQGRSYSQGGRVAPVLSFEALAGREVGPKAFDQSRVTVWK